MMSTNTCVELRRLEHIEADSASLKGDIKDIKQGFSQLTGEIHSIGLDIRSHTEILHNFIAMLSERDRILDEHKDATKETFHRLGNKIDNLEERVRTTEADRAKLSVISERTKLIEKVVFAVGAGVGTLIIFYIQGRL
jgi:CII-binding regulator of phage lambda lysogenization HflD